MKILSICIATYNRAVQLEELVKSLLEVKSDDFEVVITNNCSTDTTLAMLDRFEDDRLVVYTNQNPEPAYYNIIKSIFNAHGKYALYCNDRDLIYTGQLEPFINFLKGRDYSYLHIKKCYGDPTYNLIEYEKGFESLINHPYCDHPTGMVYNVEIIKNYLNKEDYLKYTQDIYTWCFLGRDVAIYEKTAEYDNCLWDERPSIFKVQSASGAIYKGQLYFETERTIELMEGVVTHLIGNSHFSLTNEQHNKLILNIFIAFSKRLMLKKRLYADKRECAHYGIKPRYVSYVEMRNAYSVFFDKCDKVLNRIHFNMDIADEWMLQKKSIKKSLFRKCIRCDFSILLTKIRRTFNPHYRY